MKKRSRKRPAERNPVVAGAAMGAGAGAVAALEILLGNQFSCNPRSTPVSCLILGGGFAMAGAAIGSALGSFGARLFRRVGADLDDGARLFGFLGPVLAFLSIRAVVMVLPYLALRVLRRRFLPHRPRLDSLLAFALLATTAGMIPSHSYGPRTRSSHREGGGAPVPGSIPVTVSVHPGDGFPEVAAVHPPMLVLQSTEAEKRAILWSGQSPSSGRAERYSVAGGGKIFWIPPRPWTRRLLSILAWPTLPSSTSPERRLEEIARAAGVPILTTPPDPRDPPLALRILESEDSVSPENAERYRSAGAWIDVTLGENEKIRFSGEGIRVAPDSVPATLLDVAPTVLHLLGLAVPRDFDGRVLYEILEPSGPGSRSPRYRSSSSSRSTTSR